jgi:hypothetical protein
MKEKLRRLKMSIQWNFDLNTRLEDILNNLKISGPLHLKEMAAELNMQLRSKSDQSSFKYRMKKIKDKNEILQYIGYTSNGYIDPVYLDEFAKLYNSMKSRGDGLLNKANQYLSGAKQNGKKRENQAEQLSFDDYFGFVS